MALKTIKYKRIILIIAITISMSYLLILSYEKKILCSLKSINTYNILLTIIICTFFFLSFYLIRIKSVRDSKDFFGNRKQRKRFVITVFLICLLLTQITALILYNQKQSVITNSQNLLDIAQNDANTIISAWFTETTTTITHFIGYEFITLVEVLDEMEKLQHNSDDLVDTTILKKIHSYTQKNLKMKSYQGFDLINKSGINLASDCISRIGKPNILIHSMQKSLTSAWKGNIVLVPSNKYNPVDKKSLILYLFFPLRHDDSAIPFSIYILKISPKSLLKSLKSVQIGSSGELYLINKYGSFLSKEINLKEGEALHKYVRKVMQKNKNTSVHKVQNYKENDLISIHWLRNKSLGVIAGIKSAEMFKAYINIRNILMLMISIVIMIIVGISGYLLMVGKRSYKISNRSQAELELLIDQRTQEIEMHRSQLIMILESSPIMVILSQDNKAIYFNNRSLDLLKIPKDDIDAYDIKNIYKNSELRDDITIQISINGSYVDKEMTLIKNDGSEFTARASFYGIEYNHQSAVLFWAYDVTEMSVISKKLIEATEVAESANKSKSQFLANMSHEIRTPMNAIMGMTYLAKEHASEPLVVTRYLDKVESSTQILLHIINDILDISKIETGNIALDIQEFSLIKSLRTLMDILVIKAKENGIPLFIDLDFAISRVLIADDIRLHQVLLNLVTNAIKFTKHGYVLIKLELLESQDRINNIRFNVIDTGIGISKEQQERLFKPFQQADNTTTRNYGGTGLGLSISQQLVKLMGGEITIKSKLGLGCHFSFDIPLAVGDYNIPKHWLLNDDLNNHLWVNENNKLHKDIFYKMANDVNMAISFYGCLSEINLKQKETYNNVILVENDDFKQSSNEIENLCIKYNCQVIILIEDMAIIHKLDDRGWGFVQTPLLPDDLYNIIFADKVVNFERIEAKYQTLEPFIIPDIKILVVDDNDMNQEVLSGLLYKYQCIIRNVSNGQEALDIVNEQSFDLIFMDMQMPVLDGYQTTKILRDNGVDIPIISMTANIRKEAIQLSLDNGCNIHLSKPIDVHLLDDIMRDYLYKDRKVVPPLISNENESVENNNLESVVISTKLVDLPIDEFESILVLLDKFDFKASHQFELLLNLSIQEPEASQLKLINNLIQQFKFKDAAIQLRSFISEYRARKL